MQGTLRTFSEKVRDTVKDQIRRIAENTAIAMGCTAEVEITDIYPPTVNPKTEAGHVERIAKRYFGEDMVNDNDIPVTGSEDFSYFLLEKPGCFYFLGTAQEGKRFIPHTSNFDYNDSMIASGAYLFLRIVEDRLECKLL